jgi:hypothetical protein
VTRPRRGERAARIIRPGASALLKLFAPFHHDERLPQTNVSGQSYQLAPIAVRRQRELESQPARGRPRAPERNRGHASACSQGPSVGNDTDRSADACRAPGSYCRRNRCDGSGHIRDIYRLHAVSISPLLSAHLMSPATQSLTSVVDAESEAIARTRLRRVGRGTASLGSVVPRNAKEPRKNHVQFTSRKLRCISPVASLDFHD